MTKQVCPYAALNDALADAKELGVGDQDCATLIHIGEDIAATATRLAFMANGMSDGRMGERGRYLGQYERRMVSFTAESLAQSMCECEFDWIAGFGVIVAAAKLALLKGREMDQAAAQASSDDIETVLAARSMGIGL